MSSICELYIGSPNSKLLCLDTTEAKKPIYKIQMHISSMSSET